MKMSKKTPTTARAKHMPGPWKLYVNVYPNGKLAGTPYIYAPYGPDTHRHICQPFMDQNEPEIWPQQLANAAVMTASPELLEACEYTAELIKIARRYFPKSIRNRDRFQLENACATIGKAIRKAKGDA
jgi:hypothetical protein